MHLFEMDQNMEETLLDLSMFVGRPVVALPAKRALLSIRSPLRNLQRDVGDLDAGIGHDLIVLQEVIYIYISYPNSFVIVLCSSNV